MSMLDRVIENAVETVTIPNPVVLTGGLNVNGDAVNTFTASRAIVSNGGGVLAAATTTATEIGYVNGVTSAIQTQMDLKSPIAAPVFTGMAGFTFQNMTESAAITSNIVGLNHGTVAVAATLAAPVAGKPLFVVDNSASGTAAHTVKLAAGTFDGTNNTATFDAPNEALYCIGVSATRFQIILNVGTVGLSST